VDEITPRYGRQRDRRWTPTRAKAQDTSASPNSLETDLVRGHWTPTGVEPMDQWMDGWKCQKILGCFKHYLDKINHEFFKSKLLKLS